jgi:hypothetical protein
MPGKFIPEEWEYTPSGNGTTMKWNIAMSSGSTFGRLAISPMKGIIQKPWIAGKLT